MGEKRRTKSKGKTTKATKHGLRPHEVRAQQDGVKAPPDPTTASAGDSRPPRG